MRNLICRCMFFTFIAVLFVGCGSAGDEAASAEKPAWKTPSNGGEPVLTEEGP